MTVQERFREAFGPMLGHTTRWQGFLSIYSTLADKGRAVRIVETGCARAIGNWEGDGQSTLLWGWVTRELGGKATSVDISATNAAIARSLAPSVEVVVSDSVAYLRLLPDAEDVDLLYLDSFDYHEGAEQSARHHLLELQAIYDRLPVGCLIAVDDCFSPEEGKHFLIRGVLMDAGIKPLLESYITIWAKPEGSRTWAEMERRD